MHINKHNYKLLHKKEYIFRETQGREYHFQFRDSRKIPLKLRHLILVNLSCYKKICSFKDIYMSINYTLDMVIRTGNKVVNEKGEVFILI